MVHRLDVRHLELVLALESQGSVTRAAEHLGVTPSALSHRLREAERRVGVALYRRIDKRLRPTAAGRHLQAAAQRILDDLSRAEADLLLADEPPRDVLRFCVAHYSSYHWLPGYLGALRKAEPDLDLQVVADASRQTSERLLDRSLDFAVVPAWRPRGGLRAQKLFEDELLLVMSPRHRLAGRRHVVAEDFAGEDYITYDRTPEPGYEFGSLMRPAQAYPRWTTTVELPEAIIELVRADLGMSVLTRWAVERHVARGDLVSARLTRQGLKIPWSVVTRAGETPQAASRRAARCLARWCRGTAKAFRNDRHA